MQFAVDNETGCLLRQPAPVAAMFLIDTTDKLSVANARRIATHVTDIVEGLPTYSKIVVIPFGGDLSAPLQPVFDRCVPARADEARVNQGSRVLQRRYDAFREVMGRLEGSLTTIADSPASPISQQVVRAVSDEVLHWDGESRRLVLVSDGLQSARYRLSNGELPAPPSPTWLQGVTVEYFEMGNARGLAGQTQKNRILWRDWFKSGGAQVEMIAPGF
jgi:hypothetical protein